MKRVTLSVSVCVFAMVLLAISGCSSERDRQSRVDRLHSEEWYLDDSVQMGLPGGPREPADDRDVQPAVDMEQTEQDTVQSRSKTGSGDTP